MSHTPTPWKYSRDTFGVGRIFGREPDGEYSLVTPDFDQMTSDKCDGNAAHIVRCVNAHDELRARVEELEIAIKKIAEAAHGVPNASIGYAMGQVARAALAKVTK